MKIFYFQKSHFYYIFWKPQIWEVQSRKNYQNPSIGSKVIQCFVPETGGFFPDFQYKGLLKSDGTKKGLFVKKIQENINYYLFIKKKTHITIHF